MKTLPRTSHARILMGLGFFGLSAACPDENISRREEEPSFYSRQSGEKSRPNDKGSQNLVIEEPRRDDRHDFGQDLAAERNTPSSTEVTAPASQHRLSVTISRRTVCHLDRIEFATAARRVFEGADRGTGPSPLASILVPMLSVKFEGSGTTVSGADEPPTPLQIKVLSEGAVLGVASSAASSRIIFARPASGDNDIYPLHFSVSSSGPTLWLAAQTRVCREMNPARPCEASDISPPDLTLALSFTRESCERAQQWLEVKIRNICRNMLDRIDSMLAVCSASDTPVANLLLESQRQLTFLHGEEDTLAALWTAVQSDWLQDIEIFNMHDIPLAGEEDGLLDRSRFYMQSALMQSDVLGLRRAYYETEVFLSFLSSIQIAAEIGE